MGRRARLVRRPTYERGRRMPKAKRHLVVRGSRAACGLRDPRFWTSDPAQVTCGACSKTLAMADAEVAKTKKIK